MVAVFYILLVFDLWLALNGILLPMFEISSRLSIAQLCCLVVVWKCLGYVGRVLQEQVPAYEVSPDYGNLTAELIPPTFFLGLFALLVYFFG